jgi:hypothetical protein
MFLEYGSELFWTFGVRFLGVGDGVLSEKWSKGKSECFLVGELQE